MNAGDDTLKHISDWERARSKYFLRENKGAWREVSEAEYIAAERRAGFIPDPYCGPLATAGFGYTGNGMDIEGRIDYIDVEEN